MIRTRRQAGITLQQYEFSLVWVCKYIGTELLVNAASCFSPPVDNSVEKEANGL